MSKRRQKHKARKNGRSEMPKSKIKPDYKCSSSRSGHTANLEKAAARIYNTPSSWLWPRWFDNKRKRRKVFVQIEELYGDWHHWYATVKEEQNPFWFPGDDRYDPCWVKDDRAQGDRFMEKFNTENGARAYANVIIRDHFPNHRPVRYEDKYTRQRARTWHYAREGD